MDWYERDLRTLIDAAVAEGADMTCDRTRTYRSQQESVWFRFRESGVARIALERARHRSEGFSAVSRTFDPFAPRGSARIRRMIRREVETVAALQKRDRLVESHGHDPRFPPPWAFRANRMALLLARHAGFTDEEMCRVVREPCGDDVRIHQCDKHLASHMENRADWHINVHSVGGVVRFLDIEHADLTYDDTTSQGAVLRMKAVLPESALIAIPGMDVSQIVDHAAFDGPTGVVVRKVVADPVNQKIELVLKDVLDPVAPVPAVPVASDSAYRIIRPITRHEAPYAIA